MSGLTPAQGDLIAAGGVRLYSLAQLLANHALTASPEAVAPRLGYAGRVTLIVAPPKAGKSTLAGAAAAAVSTGMPFLGEPTAAGTVLVVALDEHLGEIARRLPRFGANPDRVLVVDHLGADGLDALPGLIEDTQPRLVVVDALYRLAELAGVTDPGRSSEWPRILDPIVDATRTTDSATLLLHHARRSDGKYRDSSAIAAAVDAVVELHTSNDPRERDVRTEARWMAAPFRLRLVGDLEGNEPLAYELAGAEPSLDERVLLYIERSPGCSQKAVRDGVMGGNVTIDGALARLVERGAVEDRGDADRHTFFATHAREVAGDPTSLGVSPLGQGGGEVRPSSRARGVAGDSSPGARVPGDPPQYEGNGPLGSWSGRIA